METKMDIAKFISFRVKFFRFHFVSVFHNFFVSIFVSVNRIKIFPLKDISVSVSVNVNHTALGPALISDSLPSDTSQSCKTTASVSHSVSSPPSFHWYHYTAWWQRHMGVKQLAYSCNMEMRPGIKPTTIWSTTIWSRVWSLHHHSTKPPMYNVLTHKAKVLKILSLLQ